MKRTVLLMFALLLITVGSVGCSKYPSHYNAVGFVHSNDTGSAYMSFYEFDGNIAFKLKCKSEDQAGIKYSGKLEEGNITVYYDCGGTKEELFSIHSGEDIQSSGGYLPEDTIYIIVETSDKCRNGDLRFEVFYG
ncbi:MAG: hypothetical protein J5879_01065 [Clostridia bacterium]|nr:hypothetical protein [Clostridia bacterium]